MWIVPALIILPSEVLLKLSSRPPVAKRAAVVSSQATGVPPAVPRKKKGVGIRSRRRPLGLRILLLHQQEPADVEKIYESTIACEC